MEVTLPNRWQPRHYQRPLWTYLESGGKRAIAVWHRRAGKDEVCLHWAACAAMQRVGNYWHMLPEASQARKAVWDAINPHTGKRRIDEAFPPSIRVGQRDDDMRIKLIKRVELANRRIGQLQFAGRVVSTIKMCETAYSCCVVAMDRRYRWTVWQV